MHILPTKSTAVSFLVLTLFPSIGVPLVIYLSALMKLQLLGFILLQAYVCPPFLIATILGFRNQTSGGTYGNILFEGYIGIGPTFPLGFIFCAIIWLICGYIVWLLYSAVKQTMSRTRRCS